MTKYYKPKQIADLFLISTTKVYDLINSGKIGSIKIDGALRISEYHLNDFIKRNSNKAKTRKAF